VVLLFLCPANTFAFGFAFELPVRANRRLQLTPLELEVTAASVQVLVLVLVLALVQALLPALVQVRARVLASIVLHLQLHDFDFSDPFLYSS